MEGVQFTYAVPGQQTGNTGTFTPKDPNRIRVTQPNGPPQFWRRVR